MRAVLLLSSCSEETIRKNNTLHLSAKTGSRERTDTIRNPGFLFFVNTNVLRALRIRNYYPKSCELFSSRNVGQKRYKA